MMQKTFLTGVLGMLFMSFYLKAETLNTGPWRFELKTSYATIPFIIHIKKMNSRYVGQLDNGKETIKLSEINFKDNKIQIPLQTYEMTLEMNLPQKGQMTGFLVRHNKSPVIRTPVTATLGSKERFPEEKKKPLIDLSGKWKILLKESDSDKTTPAVLLLEQNGNALHGSILTPTGDYRYMSGFISGNEFKAASFDGVYNYVVEGEVNDGKLSAKILSSYQTSIEGKKDSQAALPDAYQQTSVESLSFAFPDLEGKKVSLQDKKFKDRPVIIQIFGSWCPNCIDEMNFLIPWYLKNKKRGVEVVALAFERSVGPDEAKRQLLKTRKKKSVPYPILIAGSTTQEKPADKLPGIKNFISFPTTIFLNKKHEVIKVHAGFTGPSTGEFFETWKKEFNQTVDELLK